MRFRSLKFATLWVLLALVVVNCKKDEVSPPLPPPVDPLEISQPPNPHDPAVLPSTTEVIVQYDGEFTPLLLDVVANWRVTSAMRFQHWLLADCWSSSTVTTQYEGVTRSGISGKSIHYPGCGAHQDKNATPNFSGDDGLFWGQYQKGVEVWDSIGHHYYQDPVNGYYYTNSDPLIRFRRYYTVPDLPDAYIKLVKRWEIIPIQGSDYAHCEGCTSLSQTTSTTTGLKVDKTQEWGYTLGYEYTVGASIKFIEAAHKLSFEFNQRFQTTITESEEKTVELTLTGAAPAGKNIIRLQSFREVSTFTLVNEDGSDYYPGVHSPEIKINTQTKNYVWYY